MIYGIGIDIVSVPEFRDVLRDGKTVFLEQYFSPEERAYCMNAREPLRAQRFAVRYAAREALVKALDGRRLEREADLDFRYREAPVANDSRGRPYLKLGGAVAEYIRGRGITRCHLSLSHTGEYAVAQVLLEKGS